MRGSFLVQSRHPRPRRCPSGATRRCHTCSFTGHVTCSKLSKRTSRERRAKKIGTVSIDLPTHLLRSKGESHLILGLDPDLGYRFAPRVLINLIACTRDEKAHHLISGTTVEDWVISTERWATNREHIWKALDNLETRWKLTV